FNRSPYAVPGSITFTVTSCLPPDSALPSEGSTWALYVAGSIVVLVRDLPKFASDIGPHSPFATGIVRSQSGAKFSRRGSPGAYRRSFHDREAVVAIVVAGSPVRGAGDTTY